MHGQMQRTKGAYAANRAHIWRRAGALQISIERLRSDQQRDRLVASMVCDAAISMREHCKLVRLVTTLEASAMAESVSASGTRSVAIGGDVINSLIITGDRNQIFVGAYEQLRDAYIAPLAVFARVQLERFVGRQWLLALVDEFLTHHDRGYFIVEGAAGVGKTTFLAQLVKQRGYVHLFCEQSPGQDRIGSGIRSLAAQLIRAWEIQPYSASDMLPGAASRPDFLEKTIFQAAQQRDKLCPDEPIVLAIDALNEAGTPPGENVLGLPRALPPGVFIVASQQPVPVSLTTDAPKQLVVLRAESAQNQDDMRAFLTQAVTWPRILSQLHAEHASPERVISTLLAKSAGVWIYLHYVLAEIERGERGLLDLDDLPDGLWAYYAHYWRGQREAAETSWDEVLLPLLATLCAVQVSEPASLLRTFSCISVSDAEVRRLLGEKWRPFVAVEEGSPPRFRPYHGSLRDFLAGKVARDNISAGDWTFIEELTEAVRQAHGRIADLYLAKWGGLEAGLPQLDASRDVPNAVQPLDFSYGLRFLAAHLEDSGRSVDLHQLLRTERVALKRADDLPGDGQHQHAPEHRLVWYEAHLHLGDVAGFMADVSRAWQLAERAGKEEIGGLSVGLQCRYALLNASIASMGSNVAPALLATAVREGLWTIDQAVAFAVRSPHDQHRDKAQEELALLAVLKGEVNDAIAVAHLITEPGRRAQVLAALAPHLPEVDRGAVLTEARILIEHIESLAYRARLLIEVAPHLSSSERVEVVGEIRTLANANPDESERAEVLARLVPILPETDRAWALDAALTITLGIENLSQRANLLALLAPLIPAATCQAELAAIVRATHRHGSDFDAVSVIESLASFLSKPLLTEVFAVVCSIDDEGYRARAFEALALWLPKQLVRDALVLARHMQGNYNRARALVSLAPRLPAKSRKAVLAEAIDATRKVVWPEGVAGVLARTAEEAFWAERNAVMQSRVLARLAPHLSRARRHAELSEALDTARQLTEEDHREEVLEALAPHIPVSLLGDALTAASSIGGQAERVIALATLLSHVPEAGRDPELGEAVALTFEIDRDDLLAVALEELASLLSRAQVTDALELALMMDVDFWSVRALAAVAARLPRPQRYAQLAEAIAYAHSKELDEYERAMMFATLALPLPKKEQVKLLNELFVLLQKSRNDEVKSHIVVELARYSLLGSFLAKGLDVAKSIEDDGERAEAFAALLPSLSKEQQTSLIRKILAIARTSEDGEGFLIAALAPYLSDPLLSEAVELAGSLRESDDRALALSALAQRVPQTSQASLMTECLALVPNIKFEGLRALVLANVVVLMPEQDRAAALAQELDRALVGGSAPGLLRTRTGYLSVLAPHLANLPRGALYPLWCQTLRFLASWTRHELLDGLVSLAPVVMTLGEAPSLKEACRAIIDVGEWFP
jgi:hypothetical protein